MPKFTIVTPVKNGEQFLEKTIRSVQQQSYRDYEHIIVDGGSTDGTLNICDKYSNSIAEVLTDDGNGMYNAIDKGFSFSSGKYLSWLNSDDIYYPWTLKTVDHCFDVLNCKWLTGIPNAIDQDDNIVRVEQAKRYFRYAINRGWYRGDCLGFIQQESTFFCRELYEHKPLRKNVYFAGDYLLWKDFAESHKLRTVRNILASFRIRPGQLSEDVARYYQESGDIGHAAKIDIVRKLIKGLSVALGTQEYMPCLLPCIASSERN